MKWSCAAVAAIGLAATVGWADETQAPGIAWYGSLAEGKRAAKQRGQPIFLMSAAPRCQGVPGVW